MFETPFYHETIKKIVIGFGAIFSQIKVIRRNPNNSSATPQIISVPIAYAPKEKFITRISQDPDLTGHVYTTLPRMAFEITNYSYDSNRKFGKNNKIICKSPEGITSTFTPVPYNIDFSLNILTKGTEDGLNIIEQILPTFSPEYTFKINAIPEMNLIQDIPLILNSVNVSDDYEGEFGNRRLVTHTLNFTAKANLFGGISKGGVILTTISDIPLFETFVASMDSEGNLIVDRFVETGSLSTFSNSVKVSIDASLNLIKSLSALSNLQGTSVNADLNVV
jgi:T4-like virus Myoviridae tail sheath stabiliser